MPKVQKVVVADWDEEIGFSEGSVVRYDGKLYKAKGYARAIGEVSHKLETKLDPETGEQKPVIVPWQHVLTSGAPNVDVDHWEPFTLEGNG